MSFIQGNWPAALSQRWEMLSTGLTWDTLDQSEQKVIKLLRKLIQKERVTKQEGRGDIFGVAEVMFEVCGSGHAPARRWRHNFLVPL